MKVRDRVVELRRVRAGDLLPSPKNWRRHPAGQADALRGALAEIGYADALIARETADGLMLIDGHLRAETTPDVTVPVLVVDLDDAEADKLLLTLDPLAAMAEAGNEALERLLAEVQTDSEALQAMLDGLAHSAGLNGAKPGLTDPNAVPEVPEPISKLGDLWLCGDHRLLCGDATKAEDVERLLDGAAPRLCVTDPPYGVELDQGWRDRRGLNRLGHAQSDRLAGDDTADWSIVWIQSPAEVAYVWSAAGALQLVVGAALQAAGYELRQQIVWVKTMAPLSRSAYHWKHEPCWYAVRAGATAGWTGDRAQTTVWEASSPKHIMGGSNEEKFDHPTQKPIECMERPIRNHEGDVYDPLLGSGTTMIACERLGRRCYGMEIEPRYVDVAVKRWEQFTGREAQLAGEREA